MERHVVGSLYVHVCKSYLLELFVTNRELFGMWWSGTPLFCLELEQKITSDCICPPLSWTSCFSRFLCNIKNIRRILMSQTCFLKSVVKSEIQRKISGCRRAWLRESRPLKLIQSKYRVDLRVPECCSFLNMVSCRLRKYRVKPQTHPQGIDGNSAWRYLCTRKFKWVCAAGNKVVLSRGISQNLVCCQLMDHWL